MKTYVAGFLFDEDYRSLALVRKNKPKWQEGKLNGVGGKVEGDETPLEAMIREFEEEAGIFVEEREEFCVLTGSDYKKKVLNEKEEA